MSNYEEAHPIKENEAFKRADNLFLYEEGFVRIQRIRTHWVVVIINQNKSSVLLKKGVRVKRKDEPRLQPEVPSRHPQRQTQPPPLPSKF